MNANYRMNATSVTPITSNTVKSSQFGSRPKEFLIEDYIYFIGSSNYYSSISPLESEFDAALCYSNGVQGFGSTDTLVRGDDDGSTGYRAYSDTSIADEILGKVGENIIYFDESSKSFYSTSSSVKLNIPLGDIPVNIQEYKFTKFNDKILVAPKARIPFGVRDLYIIDSNLEIKTIEIPEHPDSGNSVFEASQIVVCNAEKSLSLQKNKENIRNG